MATKKIAKKSTKKAPPKKSTTKKAVKKATKESAGKSSTRKFSSAASKQVEIEMRKMKQGKLKSGGSGEKVTNPKQAIAIALSEARKKAGVSPDSSSASRTKS